MALRSWKIRKIWCECPKMLLLILNTCTQLQPAGLLPLTPSQDTSHLFRHLTPIAGLLCCGAWSFLKFKPIDKFSGHQCCPWKPQKSSLVLLFVLSFCLQPPTHAHRLHFPRASPLCSALVHEEQPTYSFKVYDYTSWGWGRWQLCLPFVQSIPQHRF